MADTALNQGSPEGTAEIRDAYMAMTRTKRMYGGIMLVVFIALMTSGFMLADSRNAGGFWDGILNIFQFPGEVVREASAKAANLPALMVKFFPSLLETVNIAAASTLVGGLLAIVLSLLSTRGLARFPKAIGLFRRMMDIMRAVPEIVIALVLIFILGGGPVPAMIAIAFHTAGALGKLFSEVNENADLKPVEGLASVGANWTQRMLLGVVPQVAPNWRVCDPRLRRLRRHRLRSEKRLQLGAGALRRGRRDLHPAVSHHRVLRSAFQPLPQQARGKGLSHDRHRRHAAGR